MKVQELSQEHINEYVATTTEFWDYSKIAVKAPFSIWNSLANDAVPEIIRAFSNNKDAASHFNILFMVPLIKGEFPCVYGKSSGIIITNYRYFANRKEGLIVIPFHTIKYIGKESVQTNDGMDKAINKIFGEDKEPVVHYSKNGVDFSHKNPEFLEYLQNVYDHKEFDLLNETQKVLLENTYYDFERFNNSLVFTKIDWQKSSDYANELKKESKFINSVTKDSDQVLSEKIVEEGTNNPDSNNASLKGNVDFGAIEIGILLTAVLIFISVFMKWAYLQYIEMNDYLPQFKIIAAIDAVGILGMLTTDWKLRRSALIAAVINLIIFTIYYFKMNEDIGYGGLRLSNVITLHFGFWLGFISSIVAFLLILGKLFSKK